MCEEKQMSKGLIELANETVQDLIDKRKANGDEHPLVFYFDDMVNAFCEGYQLASKEFEPRPICSSCNETVDYVFTIGAFKGMCIMCARNKSYG